jgi:hypothetical protein
MRNKKYCEECKTAITDIGRHKRRNRCQVIKERRLHRKDKVRR